ncbi:MAG: triose-phosphate isomerase [Candidatus Omnitrophica bacterium]|nr:triose-phosphate isomerase [Candidatus Omnitrophota bacterium]
MRRPIIAGNWKLNKTIAESLELVNNLKRQLLDVEEVELVVCPPFTALAEVAEALFETNIQVGAQDCYWEDSGAFTGEVSAPMLKDAGAKFIIVGHSERRQFFSETDQTVNKKVKAVLKAGLTPIACVGENLTQREKGQTFAIIESHIKGAFDGISAEDAAGIVVAYEPVWAIGTGKTATPQQAQEAHNFIRKLLAKLYNDDVAGSVRIQYGGSVKPANARELMAQADIDGALVGGASLEAESFAAIVNNSRGVSK